MPTVRIYGASDDLVEFVNVTSAKDILNESDRFMHGPDAEFDVYDVDSTYTINGLVHVQAFYRGTWEFSVGMVNEEAGWPGWPVRIYKSDHNNHSMEVEIEVMDDTVDVVRIH